jgi:predicted  nucleic acid-binding Zn-ribbon protein
MTPQEAAETLRAWLPPTTMKSQTIVRPPDAKQLHEAVKVLVAEATAHRQKDAEAVTGDREVTELIVRCEQLCSQVEALEHELAEAHTLASEIQAVAVETHQRNKQLTVRLGAYREALGQEIAGLLSRDASYTDEALAAAVEAEITRVLGQETQ